MKYRNNFTFILFIIILIIFYGMLYCPEIEADGRKPRLKQELFRWFQINDRLYIQRYNTVLHSGQIMKNYYRENSFHPLWVNDEGLKTLARQFIDVLEGSEKEGLFPEEYHLPLINYLKLRVNNREGNYVDNLMIIDLLLTDAFFIYTSDLMSGRLDIEKRERVWVKGKNNYKLKNLLSSLRLKKDTLLIKKEIKKVGPRFPQYKILKDKLVLYREVLERGDWSVLEDELSPRAIVDKIIINLERLRWVSQNPQESYILVNIPQFRLSFIENGEREINEKVIVGKKERETPVFSSIITGLIFNPRWYIPRSIAVKDFLPHLKEDNSYLEEKKIRVYEKDGSRFREVDPESIDWKELDKDSFKYFLWQDSGPWNALGRVLFQSPNKKHIYIHDTPEKYLFNYEVRTASSGCVRVENAVKMAKYFVKNYTEIDESDMEDILASDREIDIALTENIPIHFMYMTVWFDKDGDLRFFRDVYNRDPEIKELYFNIR